MKMEPVIDVCGRTFFVRKETVLLHFWTVLYTTWWLYAVLATFEPFWKQILCWQILQFGFFLNWPPIKYNVFFELFLSFLIINKLCSRLRTGSAQMENKLLRSGSFLNYYLKNVDTFIQIWLYYKLILYSYFFPINATKIWKGFSSFVKMS